MRQMAAIGDGTRGNAPDGLSPAAPSRRAELAPHTVFLILFTTFGLAFLLITPPFQVPDEPSHWFRAYAITEGELRIRSYGGVLSQPLPESLLEVATDLTVEVSADPRKTLSAAQVLAAFDVPLEPQRRAHAVLPRVSMGPVRYTSHTYLPTLYLPGAAAIALGRVLGLSALSLLYAARAGFLLASVAVMYLALRDLQRLRWLFIAVALVPMSVYLTASANPDGLLTSLTLALAMMIVQRTFTERRMTARSSLLLLVLLFLIVSHKPVYAPLALALWMIPAARFAHSRAAGGFRIATLVVIAAACAASVLWLYAPIPASSDAEATLPRWEASPADPSVDPSGVVDLPEQLRIIVRDPFGFVGLTARYFLEQGPVKMYEMIGRFGIRFDAPYPYTPRALTVFLLLALALMAERPAASPTPTQRALLVLACLICILGIAAALFLAMTPPGSPSITGIQGRYFLPLIPFMLLALVNRRTEGILGEQARRRLVLIVPSFALLTALWAIAARFYGVISPFAFPLLQ
jgi:uncharacterized membrane protein